MSNIVLTSLEDGVFTITLNNPTKHNCIGLEMLYALQEAFTTAEKDNNVKVVVVTGAGEKAFSAGGNTKEFGALEGDDVDRWIVDGNKIFNQLEELSKPTIALINGYAMGGGLELAICCDFRLATPNALLASPELKNGWLPGWGGITRLKKLIGPIDTKRIVLLSEQFDAEASEKIGLITKILSSDKKEDEVSEFISPLKELKPSVFALAKAAILDENRTTVGTDLQFDVMAVAVSREN